MFVYLVHNKFHTKRNTLALKKIMLITACEAEE